MSRVLVSVLILNYAQEVSLFYVLTFTTY